MFSGSWAGGTPALPVSARLAGRGRGWRLRSSPLRRRAPAPNPPPGASALRTAGAGRRRPWTRRPPSLPSFQRTPGKRLPYTPRWKRSSRAGGLSTTSPGRSQAMSIILSDGRETVNSAMEGDAHDFGRFPPAPERSPRLGGRSAPRGEPSAGRGNLSPVWGNRPPERGNHLPSWPDVPPFWEDRPPTRAKDSPLGRNPPPLGRTVPPNGGTVHSSGRNVRPPHLAVGISTCNAQGA